MRIRKTIAVLSLALLGVAAAYPLLAEEARMMVRIKDATRLEGQESYTLTGIGIVTGLDGTGDSDKLLSQRILSNLLQSNNIIVKETDLKAQNISIVSVTATVKHSAHKGDMIQATVACIGDASSLQGGELVATPLYGPDGEPWAYGQGPVTTGGFKYGGGNTNPGQPGVVNGSETVQKNHANAGMLNNGVKLLKDVGVGLANSDVLAVLLREPDFTSAQNAASAINAKFFGSAVAVDDSTIKVRVPKEYREDGQVSLFISDMQQIYFHPDSSAKVVFNERTGTIVIGGNVRISSAAVAHGNINVTIKNTAEVSQPSPFLTLVGDSGAVKTQPVVNQTTKVDEEKVPVFDLPDTTTVADLVKVLNTLGVTPRDIMIIFQVLRSAGALHAELEAI